MPGIRVGRTSMTCGRAFGMHSAIEVAHALACRRGLQPAELEVRTDRTCTLKRAPRLALVSLLSTTLCAGDFPYFSVLSPEPGAWPAILSSIGLQQVPAASARVFVARAGADAFPEWPARVERGAILILEGESSLAELFGFRRGSENVRVSSLVDVHNP